MLRLIKNLRELSSYGIDINIFAKGLRRPNKIIAYKLKGLPKTKKQLLVLIKGDKENG